MDTTINYPPKEILKPLYVRPDYELIVLWMLNNNEFCTWANLQTNIQTNQTNISKSTLQVYLKKLRENGYIIKSLERMVISLKVHIINIKLPLKEETGFINYPNLKQLRGN